MGLYPLFDFVFDEIALLDLEIGRPSIIGSENRKKISLGHYGEEEEDEDEEEVKEKEEEEEEEEEEGWW